MMNVRQLEKILSVYGADMDRWPREQAADARALLAESQEARNLYKQAESLDRALDSFAPPPLPAGLAVRAANESLLRARSAKKKKTGFALPKFRLGGSWMPAGAALAAVTAAVVLMIALPHRQAAQPQEGTDVASFIQTMDQQASAEARDIKDTDDVLAMLDSTVSAPPAPPANPDGGVTSDQMMNTLFGSDPQDDDSWLQKL